MKRVSARWLLVVGAVCAAVVAQASRALAQTEYCPATVQSTAAVGVRCRCGPSALWGYVLSALGPRIVSGTIEVQTDAGWFSFPFTSVALTQYAVHYSSPYVAYTHNEYDSLPLYVRFPEPLKIIRLWVETASAHDDAIFNWDAHGTVTCQL